MVDAAVSKTVCPKDSAGSSPAPGTNFCGCNGVTARRVKCLKTISLRVKKMSRLLRTTLSLTAIGTLALSVAAQSVGMPQPGQTPVGMPQPGMTPAGMMPAPGSVTPSMPYSGRPYGNRNGGSDGIIPPGIRPVMRGFTDAPFSTKGYICQTENEWISQYSGLVPNFYNDPYYQIPRVADFGYENVAVIKIGGDFGSSVTPTVESIQNTPYGTIINYVVWVPVVDDYAQGRPDRDRGRERNRERDPGADETRGKDKLRGNDRQNVGVRPEDAVRNTPVNRAPRPTSNQGRLSNSGYVPGTANSGQASSDAPNVRSRDGRAFGSPTYVVNRNLSPFVVVRYPRVAGGTSFVGRVEYFRPYGWGW